MKRAARTAAAALAALLVLFPGQSAASTAPSVVFLLLDTTRADRLSAWGNPRETTPHLDRLAGRGVRFARHFANAHATRPSMPQLMSGRYYLSNILAPFRSRRHPRDYPFARPPARSTLLPTRVRDAGYHLAAVSAHPWVARESVFGADFHTFDLLPAPGSRGHAAAAAVVDRALVRWRERPADRPTFLYLHFMDTHMPRHVPVDALRFGSGHARTSMRFDEHGEPRFGPRRRGWNRSDASDFTAADRRYVVDVYDTILAILDEEIGRLLAVLERDDPGLEKTLVVAIADHGEELGAYGRTAHEDSLADAVQHVPWILAGAGIDPGQIAHGVSEHVDVVPTLLDLLGLPQPAPMDVDGRALLVGGTLCRRCLGTAPVYAWEDYRAIRLGRRVVRLAPRGSVDALCRGATRLMAEDRVSVLDAPRKSRRARVWLERRLAARETAFRRARYDVPTRPFVVPAAFWQVADHPPLTCLEVGFDTPRASFAAPGWIWTGRGLAVMHGASDAAPLELSLEVPDGRYAIAVGARPAAPPPRVVGYRRWLRRAFRDTTASERHELGWGATREGRLSVRLAPAVARHRHLVEIELTPVGAGLEGEIPAPAPALATREQLRRLGYLE